MTFAEQKAALVAGLSTALAAVNATDVVDESTSDLQTTLDAVNEQFDLLKNTVEIARSFFTAAISDAEKVAQIAATLGPQEP